MSSLYQKAYFLLSAAEIKQLPDDQGIEVAIVGRSNAGKSSVINRITHTRNLARVSKTPGRTQLLNIFVLDDNRRLIDLPGYGFAKAPLAAKLKWEKLIDTYICERESLKGLIVVMDIRHPFRDLDMQLLEYCDHRDLPVHILLNKADKLSKSAVAKTLQEAKTVIEPYRNPVTYQSFSASSGLGVKELQAHLDKWYMVGK